MSFLSSDVTILTWPPRLVRSLNGVYIAKMKRYFLNFFINNFLINNKRQLKLIEDHSVS